MNGQKFFKSPNATDVWYASGGMNVETWLNYLNSTVLPSKVSTTGHTANRIFISNSGGTLTTSSNLTYTDGGTMTLGGTAPIFLINDSNSGPQFLMYYAGTSSNRLDIVQNDGNTRIFGVNNASSGLAQTFDLNALGGSAGVSTFRINRDVSTTAAAQMVFFKSNGSTDTAAVIAMNAAALETRFNDMGEDIDFRIEGDTDANLFKVDASTDRIGIGIAAPTAKFHQALGDYLHEVSGSGATISHTISNSSNTASAKTNLVIKTAGTTADDPFITFQITSGSPANFSLGQDNSDSDFFKISRAATLGSNDCIVINATSQVGIGGNPSFAFDVPSATANARIGKVELGNWPANSTYAYFGNETLDHSTAGNYALLQYTDGSTYLNAASGQSVYHRINNTTIMQVNSTGLGIGTAAGYKLHVVGSSMFLMSAGAADSFFIADADEAIDYFKVDAENYFIMVDPAAFGGRFGIGTDAPQETFDMRGGNFLMYQNANGEMTHSIRNVNTSSGCAVTSKVEVGGGSAGDAKYQAMITSGQTWSWGLDNSASDTFVISSGSSLGTNNAISISTGLSVSFTGNNVDATRSQTAGAVSFTASNTANASNDYAGFIATVGGTSAGDPTVQFNVTSGATWSIGIDNSDSDKWKVSNNATVGTSDAIKIDTNELVETPVGLTSPLRLNIPIGNGSGDKITNNGDIEVAVYSGVEGFGWRVNGNPVGVYYDTIIV